MSNGVMAYFAYATAAKELLKRTELRALDWRHHGLGMLQGEITEEIRVHIFHPSLRTIPIEGFRDIHDHRFAITSYIAHGSITDVPHAVLVPESEYAYKKHPFAGSLDYERVDAWEIKHAKVQDGVDCTPLGTALVRALEPVKHSKGEVYTIPRRAWHTTQINEFAITVVHRGDFDDKPARILGKGVSAINKWDPIHWTLVDAARDIVSEM